MTQTEGTTTPQASDSMLKTNLNELDLELCDSLKAKARDHRRLTRPRLPDTLKRPFPRPDFSWIVSNFDSSHLKPVIRAAISAWVCLLLLMSEKTLNTMGQSGFLILLASFLSPPVDPFIAVFEREISNIGFVLLSFLWSCLCIFLSSFLRKEFNKTAGAEEIFTGRYIEAGPTTIHAIFLFFGTAFLLFARAKNTPGPFAVGSMRACVATDIVLTTTHFYPYAAYQIAIGCVLPFVFQSASAMVCSVFIFPETVNAQFMTRFRRLLTPLSNAMRNQKDILNTTAAANNVRPEELMKLVDQADAALGPLSASNRLMKKNVSWGRFGPEDFVRLQELARQMIERSNGMLFFFKIIGSKPSVSHPSLLGTVSFDSTRSQPLFKASFSSELLDGIQSLPKVFVKPSDRQQTRLEPEVATSIFPYSRQLHRADYEDRCNQDDPQHHLTNDASHRSPSRYEEPIDIFESQRCRNNAARSSDLMSGGMLSPVTRNLGDSALELVGCCADALDHILSWLECVGQDGPWELCGRKRNNCEAAVCNTESTKEELQRALDEFWNVKRHLVLGSYRSTNELHEKWSPTEGVYDPHLFLSQCFLYQYHLMSFSRHICQFLDEMIKLEGTRRRARLLLPEVPFRQFFMRNNPESVPSRQQREDDEDPDIVQGIDPMSFTNVPAMRDPDALPPRTKLQELGCTVHDILRSLGHGNAIFALKAGALSLILSFSIYMRSSAEFTYLNRSIWALIYGQLTLGRFKGDTAFTWIFRVISTFLGCFTGMLTWYLSTGSGEGNAYGLAAVSAICFPLFFFIRQYFPASPMTLTSFCVSLALVIGFSWQDTHNPTQSTAGVGFHAAWKRFLLVTMGVFTAFLFSFLPPTKTLRCYLRATYATTADRLGKLYCDVISLAIVPGGKNKKVTSKDLAAVRRKLKRAMMLKKNITYELSLRGEWPEQRYNTVNETQMDIAYLFSHLRAVTDAMEPLCARKFLEHARLLEPKFQSNVLGVINMVSLALRTGTPLPQATMCPLLNNYAGREHSMSVLPVVKMADSESPDVLTAEALEDEQSLYFNVGVVTVFMIIQRLDRLMTATKELVGEQYHIRGLPLCDQE